MMIWRIALALGWLPAAFAADIYFNDFNGPLGTTYPEWTSTGYTNTANMAGTVKAGAGPQAVANVDSPNKKQRFLGEFGGPAIVAAPPYDPQHFVRVDETVTLTLNNLKPHSQATVSFDLYVLKSWDGNNPNYGPDRWRLSVEGGATLLDTTFSNNFKTGAYDLSLQNYPAPGSPPQTSAAAVNTLGYTFFGDSIYHLTFTFPHAGAALILHFSSSMFEGKGTDDESWGLDNVRVSTNQDNPLALVASTYLGGSRVDAGAAVAVDAAGYVYLTGSTKSPDFPLLNPLQPAYGGGGNDQRTGGDAFVMKLAPDGSLVWSTYLGGSGDDVGRGIAVDAQGNVYVTGFTDSTDFPTVNALQPALAGEADAFVAKLDPGGSSLIYSTYLGGSAGDIANAIAVDADGNACITGSSDSPDFPLANAAQSSFGGHTNTNFLGDAFVARLSADGGTLIYSTFLGGGQDDSGQGIAAGPDGSAYVTGFTLSKDFPAVNALQSIAGGGGDAFAARLDPSGGLVYSTYLGGRQSDTGSGIAVDGDGNAYIVGTTRSADFPVLHAPQATLSGGMFFQSADRGDTWTSLSNGLASPTVTALAVDPSDPATIYAGTVDAGVFRSEDGGAAWIPASAGLTGYDFNAPALQVDTLAVDPATPSTLYAGVEGGSGFKSTDGGRSWQRLAVGSTNVVALAVDPQRPSTLYAGMSFDSLYKSTDAGAAWTALSGVTHAVRAVAVDPSNTNTVYVSATEHGMGFTGYIYQSTDGGGHWTIVHDGPSTNAIAVEPSAAVYAGGLDGMYRSSDGGETWTPINNGLTGIPVSALAACGAVFAGTQDGVFRSIDAGAAWQRLQDGLGTRSIRALAVASDGTVYAGADVLSDAFVVKLDPSGTALLFATYLGGGLAETGNAISLTAQGNVYITGSTASTDLTTVNAFQPQYAGGRPGLHEPSDAFVALLDPDAGALLASSYLGGSGDESGAAIAVDPAGNAWITGWTDSPDFPLRNPIQSAFPGMNGGRYGSGSVFVSKVGNQ